MKPRQLSWKWLLLGLVALLLIGVAIFPRLVGSEQDLRARVSAALSDWTGGEVRLTGPLRVHYFPDISIKGGLELSDPSRLPLVKSIKAEDVKISLDLPALLLGRISVDALRLSKPEITLKDTSLPAGAPGETPSTLIANLLSGTPVNVVRLRDGTINFPTQSGIEVISKIYARFDASAGTGAMSSLGSFLFRNETVRFALDTGVAADGADGPVVPVGLTLTSTPVVAKLAGSAGFASGLQMNGDLRLEMADARRFLNWVGIALPDGQSLKALSAAGTVHWSGSTLTFDDGAFTLDGNSADGVLAVTTGKRPRVEGTLAFGRLVLDPYLGDGDGETDAATAASGPLFGWALLKRFDADLRISAAEISAASVKLGRGGFTITAREDVLASEVGELELCGGSASGRIGLDISQPTVKATLVGNLTNVAVETCLQPFALPFQAKGTANLKAEIVSEGATSEELIRALSGSLKLNAQNGAVPVDFARLLTTASPLEGEGWSREAATAFDSLNADCRLAAGHIWCQMFNMQTRRGLISGSGDVDLARQTLDWSLSVAAGRVDQVEASQLSAETPPRVSIRGSLSQPMIRRADRPTLGEGTTQTNSLANPVSPR